MTAENEIAPLAADPSPDECEALVPLNVWLSVPADFSPAEVEVIEPVRVSLPEAADASPDSCEATVPVKVIAPVAAEASPEEVSPPAASVIVAPRAKSFPVFRKRIPPSVSETARISLSRSARFHTPTNPRRPAKLIFCAPVTI